MKLTGEKETILIAALERASLKELQHELHSHGYGLLTGLGAEEVGSRLAAAAEQPIHLIVVSAVAGVAAARKKSEPAGPSLQESCGLCRTVRALAAPRGIPILLITSVWAEAGLADSLEAGADYLLFAPHRQDQLLFSLRNALLNGPSDEPPGGRRQEPVEIVHQDRLCHVQAGRARLARLSFSLFEELKQASSALSWSQSENEELQQQLRQERQHAQRAIQLPEEIEGIAHDFSNLLETVEAAATVLRTGPAQPAPYHAAMDAALAQVATLIEDLQNWTSWEENGGRREAVQLSEVAADVLEAALLPMKAPNIRVRVRTQNLPLIWTNRALLFRSLSNLVWNAVQAMPTGGILSILGYVRQKEVLLEVSDTGAGVAEENLERIFSPRFSTKKGHAGIGLFVVKNLVHRGGGEISFVESRGSTFALSFPISPSESPHLHSTRPRSTGSARRRSVAASP